jgi:hypothetical protein
LILVQADLQGLVIANALHVGGEVVEDLEREIAERFLGTLDALAGVRFGEGYAQVFSDSLQFSRLMRLGNFSFGILREGVEIFYAVPKVFVVDARFEAELVFDCTRKSYNEIESRTVAGVSCLGEFGGV